MAPPTKQPPPTPPPLPSKPLFTSAEVRRADILYPPTPSSSSNNQMNTSQQPLIYQNPTPPTISLADTIADVSPFIPITLDLADRKSTRLNSSHSGESRMPSSA